MDETTGTPRAAARTGATNAVSAADAAPPTGEQWRGTAPGGFMEPIRAAGAVLWREGARSGREVALVHRPDRADWSLPKGKLKSREHVLTGALREVHEETGLVPRLGRRLPAQCYLKDGWPKQVEWWAATADEAGAAASTFVPNDEIDEVRWAPLDRARELLSHAHDRALLDAFTEGPAATVAVVLLRHASAGRKAAWTEHDLLRPLDEGGRAGALRLADVLSVFPVPRVVTSAAARCTETVLPFAVAHGAEIGTERAFTANVDDAGETWCAPEPARAAFTALLAAREPVLVCTHGELVAELMREALHHLGAPVSQQLTLSKSAFWVLHIAIGSGELAAVERHSAWG